MERTTLNDSSGTEVLPASCAVDVLICLGDRDIHRLFRMSLTSCFRHFTALNRIFVVTDSKELVKRCLEDFAFKDKVIVVMDDREILPADLHTFPGWYRQQFLKLYADQIAGTELIACLGADTVILRKIEFSDIVANGEPILYYNRYPSGPNYLDWEKERVVNVAKILHVKPLRSFPLGDFIMDFNILKSAWLKGLRQLLCDLYGKSPFLKIVPQGFPITSEMRKEFGEWSLYAVFVLDVLNANLTIRNSNSQFLAQIQTERALKRFQFDSKIVHFVKKTFDLQYIKSHLRQVGISEC